MHYRPAVMDPDRPTVFQGNDNVNLPLDHFVSDLIHRVDRTEILELDGRYVNASALIFALQERNCQSSTQIRYIRDIQMVQKSVGGIGDTCFA